ncbi:DNA polymerase-3 subunit alpha [Butyrivibrio hungatei]|uniref:DNA polymerase III PolC-type n=1 Tax=Butyrivibrio hungatei TaxID=185008 RepID=A0A1G5AD15_9FIRM|nr:PolC-type DNA polymerase III [Butyrivibrio hungatei]SCX75776.1 DNA polymerase-3 subunit alpha [Butyrivibrio hungatei]
MSKSFFEVFPTLKLDAKTKEIMEQTVVEKVSTTRKQDFIRIYISSNNLIDKADVIKAETGIKKQFFGNQDLTVKIYEKFSLSAQYTPKNLIDIYKDSIELELKDYDHMEYSLFRSAQFLYPEDGNIVIQLEDSVVGQKKAPDLVRVLSKIINERCGLTASITPEFIEVVKNTEEPDYSAESAKMAKKLEDAEQRSEEKKKQKEEQEAAKTAAAEKKTAPEKPAGKAFGKEGGASKGKWGGKRDFGGSFKRSDNPDVIFGRDFDDETMKLSDLVGELGEVCVHGKVILFDKRDIRNEKSILIFDITDFTDSITVKMFVRTEDVPEITKDIKMGAFLKIKGIAAVDKFDHELSIQSVAGVKKIPDFTSKRVDRADVKRVELHCHTKMSDMDGVSEVKDIVKQAYKWGMPGIAITDHGVVQALTDANHVWEDLYSAEKKRRKEAGEPPIERQDFFKLILGVEAYVVDDLKEIVVNDKGQPIEDTTFVVFDIETTGFSPIKNKIIEIGAVKVRNGEILERFSEFINPEVPIPYRITKLTSITDDMVIDAPTREVIIPRFVEFCKDAVLVGHNVGFDISFINQNCKELGIDVDYTTVDTLWLSRYFFPLQAKHTLDAVAKTLGVVLEHHHRAVDDAECTALIFNKFVPMLKEQKAETLTDVNILGKPTKEMIRHLRPNHCIILAKNTLGRVNLYTLVSESHVDYFRRFPLVPKSELIKHREGLIVGSACCAGELYGAVVEGRPPEEIARLVDFYDYLEIQPVANNRFMIDSERYEDINSEEDIKNINKEIVRLGEQFNKPVVATCDAHFLNPEDEIYRTIIMAGKGMNDEEESPLFLRTTDEMMAEFDYLGGDKAKEIVIDNTRMILDMCDSISPVRPDKCAPVIENSDEILTKICYDKAHEIYGDNLPEIVQERLERELNSIIKNGFAVMYIIAQKLVWKSNEDGYLVGSRGSVGSSFVAFTSGITEVNSLSPHYVCPKCKYSDFDSEEVLKYGGNSGCDMPDKRCPKCGALLYKDGFDIPFETFLGFKGDKEPDIDLNFSGEYQSKAHKYTEVIFGYGQTFRAGTIASLADKTAYGFVKKYYDGIGSSKRKCEINRIVQGCTGIRRGTGQHPGGIIVLPVGEDINSFCPVQHPANDMTTATITTHYDYHSIDHNLLKLDILGHDDPTMIRFLQDCTGLDPKLVPLDDKNVMSLFMNTTALGVTPEQLGGTKLGCLGLPEFGTDFAMQMVIDAKPTSLSHLIRISGLSHGTDVWLGNAQTLIQEGKATIDTCICCRDDIMIYLIQKGMDKSLSFKTMESVRKGKGLKPEMEEAMIAAGVPDWYIWSCKKIKYMFPKAHAAAYVMMAWRIAYFKVYVPQAFYAAWFSIRAKAFNYEHMCQGENHLHAVMNDYKNRKDELSNAQQAEYGDMRLVEEMYERGIEFLPIDIFKAKSREFQVIGDKIMPALNSIDGMGEKAADQIVEAAKDGPFLSKDDFKQRTKCPQAVIDKMADMGLLGDIPDSNQISIFDLMKG